jgi:hypothetical protein
MPKELRDAQKQNVQFDITMYVVGDGTTGLWAKIRRGEMSYRKIAQNESNAYI